MYSYMVCICIELNLLADLSRLISTAAIYKITHKARKLHTSLAGWNMRSRAVSGGKLDCGHKGANLEGLQQHVRRNVPARLRADTV